MSPSPDPHGSPVPHAHDAHAFTGEPVQVLPADEPRTPGWLPLLGVALFTGAAVIFLAGRGASPEATAPAAASPTATSAIVKPARPQPVPQAPSGSPTAHGLTPEQREQLANRAGRAKPPPAPPAH